MSSSSSDSDSDDFEPVRRIKINIRPKEEVVRRGAADVSEIKASVEAWRPLGPPTHPSLTRRQSSLSSVSSMSFGTGSLGGGGGGGSSNSNNNNSNNTTTGISAFGHNSPGMGAPLHSSPSCSSLVSEFNNRSSFTNFMSATSRTSSPLTLVNHGDAVPIAIAIQESIELIVKGHYDPNAIEPKFHSRFLGNIKVAFPNAFARGNYGKPSAALKLRIHSTEHITRYYASRLIKDLNLGTNSVAESTDTLTNTSQLNNSNNNERNNSTSINGHCKKFSNNLDPLDPFNPTPSTASSSSAVSSSSSSSSSAATDTVTASQPNSRIIEFDMEALLDQLRKMYDQSPTSRYYNIDVLRYQIAPITSIEECPLQVCAYWKVESELVKLRIDFKHSNKSGLNLERLREISFTVNFANFIPTGIDINSLSPDSVSNLRLNNNNNNSSAMNMNNFESSPPCNRVRPTARRPLSLIDDDDFYVDQPTGSGSGGDSQISIGLPGAGLLRGPPPPPLPPPLTKTNQTSTTLLTTVDSNFSERFDLSPTPNSSGMSSNNSNNNNRNNSNLLPTMPPTIRRPSNTTYGQQQNKPPCNNHNLMPPYITYEPQAHWNSSIKQLTWKFDTLLSYHKTDGSGSLFAKLDFRNYNGMPSQFLENCIPTPVDVKFLVTDSTLSKISTSIDSIGYKMSLLKREIRSGRYKSEPYIL